jgi:hypothetical protein
VSLERKCAAKGGEFPCTCAKSGCQASTERSKRYTESDRDAETTATSAEKSPRRDRRGLEIAVGLRGTTYLPVVAGNVDLPGSVSEADAFFEPVSSLPAAGVSDVPSWASSLSFMLWASR